MDTVIANVLPHGRAFFVLVAYPALWDVKYLLITVCSRRAVFCCISPDRFSLLPRNFTL